VLTAEKSLAITPERIALLQGMAVFGALNEAAIRFILEHAEVRTVKAGDYFVREDETGDAAFALEVGKVELLKHFDGRDFRLHTMQAGDCFGEMALLGLMPRSVSVRAIEHCEAIRISHAVLSNLYAYSPKQYTTILMNMARDMSRRLHEADDRLVRYMARCGPSA